MSIQEQIRVLEQLSALDQEIRRTEEQLDGERLTLKNQRERLEQLVADIEGYEANLVSLSEKRTQLSQEVRQLAAQVEKSKEKMSRARNERETNAATREFEDLRRIQKDREEEIAAVQEEEAETKKKNEEAKELRKKLEEELNTTEGETNEKIAKLEAHKEKQLQERSKLLGQLPRRLVARYEMIRKRRGVAIALANGGSCSECHMALPPQLYQRILRSKDIEQCPSCQRLLYYRPETAAENASNDE